MPSSAQLFTHYQWNRPSGIQPQGNLYDLSLTPQENIWQPKHMRWSKALHIMRQPPYSCPQKAWASTFFVIAIPPIWNSLPPSPLSKRHLPAGTTILLPQMPMATCHQPGEDREPLCSLLLHKIQSSPKPEVHFKKFLSSPWWGNYHDPGMFFFPQAGTFSPPLDFFRRLLTKTRNTGDKFKWPIMRHNPPSFMIIIQHLCACVRLPCFLQGPQWHNHKGI